MSYYVEKFEFKNKPKEINYIEGEPLKLTEDFRFYHNKIRFRKELTPLQFLFNEFFNTTLQAAGIRDSYLKREYTDTYLIVIFCDTEEIKNTNQIIEKHFDKNLEKGCYYMEGSSEYLLLLTKDMEGIKAGIEKMKEILEQVLDDYFRRKNFDEYIKLRPFNLFDCV
jgi:hypothetical protein